jgi:2-polyprenyl-6-methoxyphenol hydroxylase-like FAD-dependent oxidoreductase
MTGKILISGAGIAGPALAYWLQKASFAPTIIERAPILRAGGFVIDFWGLGYDLAERMGLADNIGRLSYRIREMRIVNDRGKRVAGFGIGVLNELTGGRFATLPRSELSRLLYEKIAANTEAIFGDEIVDLEQQTGGVGVRFKHAAARSFDLVIGADGLHSGVRKITFGAQEKFERQLGYAVAAFEVAGYRPRDENVYVIYSQPGRMLGRVALRDDRTLFLFVYAADSGSLSAMSDLQAQKAKLRETFGTRYWECAKILDALDGAQELYFDRVSQIKMPSWSRGRVALVGDAAFCMSLMAGQGSALAVTSAYVLAGELAKAGGRHAEAFASYEALLRNYIAAKQRGAERFSAAFAPKTRWGLYLRNAVINVWGWPGTRSAGTSSTRCNCRPMSRQTSNRRGARGPQSGAARCSHARRWHARRVGVAKMRNVVWTSQGGA